MLASEHLGLGVKGGSYFRRKRGGLVVLDDHRHFEVRTLLVPHLRLHDRGVECEVRGFPLSCHVRILFVGAKIRRRVRAGLAGGTYITAHPAI